VVEMFCLSEPGYHDHVEGLLNKYGSIVRMWAGPYLFIGVAEANYVEVSKHFEQRKNDKVTFNCGVTVRLHCAVNCNFCASSKGFK
jgi:hypothetical protein